MLKQIAGCIVSVAVLFTSLAAVWNQWGTDQANGLVDEANALVDLGAKYHNEAVPKFNTFSESLASFPGDRTEMESNARELGDLYARTAEQYRQAAEKLDAASKEPTDPKVAEYFAQMSRKWTKTAEAREVLRLYVLLVVDPKIETSADLKAFQEVLNGRIAAVVKEEKELDAAAKKIQNENPSKFK